MGSGGFRVSPRASRASSQRKRALAGLGRSISDSVDGGPSLRPARQHGRRAPVALALRHLDATPDQHTAADV
eukprot:scaffold4633_cov114-Isochrysis_galbana.AAC.10